jgi:hypothetical protein
MEVNDVMFVPSFDGASEDAVSVLAMLQDVVPDETDPEAPECRSVPVEIGEGPTARVLNRNPSSSLRHGFSG